MKIVGDRSKLLDYNTIWDNNSKNTLTGTLFCVLYIWQSLLAALVCVGSVLPELVQHIWKAKKAKVPFQSFDYLVIYKTPLVSFS